MHQGLATFAASMIWLLSTVPAAAQSIDAPRQVLRLGEPLHLELKVRGFETDPARVRPECLGAEISQAGEPLPAGMISIQTTALADDGLVLARISSPVVVSEPVVHVRISLSCGASYAREFSLLADPPAGTRSSRTANSAARPSGQPPDSAAGNATPRPWPGTEPGRQPARSAAQRSPSESRGSPTAAPAAAPTTTDERAVERIAQAVMALLARRLPDSALAVTASASSATPAVALDELWQRELQRLRAEQRQSDTHLASLRWELERTRDEDRLRWLAAAGLAAVLLIATASLRWLHELRLPRMAGSTRTPAPPTTTPAPTARRHRPAFWRLRRSVPEEDASAACSSTAGFEGLPSRPGSAPSSASTTSVDIDAALDFLPHYPADEVTAERSRRWENADFGESALVPTPRPDWLREVDRMAEAGYHGASIALLENALHRLPAKHPVLLLRLLDLYGGLRQSSNHERVAAQLEALYNVSVPMLQAGDDDGAPLEVQPDLLEHVSALWSQPAAATRLLEGWLLPGPDRPRLSVACFRDTLMLHGLSTELAEACVAALDTS